MWVFILIRAFLGRHWLSRPPLISFPLASWLPPLLKPGFGDSQRSKRIFRPQAPTWRHPPLHSASALRRAVPTGEGVLAPPARSGAAAGHTPGLDHTERPHDRKQPKSKRKCQGEVRHAALCSRVVPERNSAKEKLAGKHDPGGACTCPRRDQLRQWPSIHSLPSSSAKVRLSQARISGKFVPAEVASFS